MNKNNDAKSLPVNEIYISIEEIERIKNLKEKEIKNYIKRKLDNFEQNFDIICNEFTNVCEKNNEFIPLNNNLYYVPKIKAIIPDISAIECHLQKSSNKLDKLYIKEVFRKHCFSDFFEKFKISLPIEEISNFILKKNDVNNFIAYIKNRNCCDRAFDGLTCIDEDTIKFYEIEDSCFYEYENKNSEILTFPIFYLEKNNKFSYVKLLLYLIENAIPPKKDIFDREDIKESFDFLKYLYKQNNENILPEIKDNSCLRLNNKENAIDYFYKEYRICKNKNIYFSEIEKIALSEKKIVADNEFRKQFMEDILKSDMERVAFEKDDFKEYILEDVLHGHWDLWDYNDLVENNSKGYAKVSLPKCFYKRNPFYDVKKLDNVAIDFGTKSTVVCFKDEDQNILAQIISRSSFGNQKFDPYENPSVIEFRDINSFIEEYNKKAGRPTTKWNDLIVSHDAFSDMTSAEEFYTSFMIELKSWCYRVGEIVDKEYMIEDRKKYPHLFPPYLDIKDGEPDPIEYYAYYLGLYINKLSDNSIYSTYTMSFPLTFNEKVKKHLLSSFEKGIRKSLPTALLNDEKFKKKLDKGLVHYGISEPAAYAITALKEYGFRKKIIDKKENEIYYAVFDFGGGTTDFDFGIYSLNDGSDMNYPTDECPVTLTHFGAKGLDFLGGEKLIKYLAFELFKINKVDTDFNGRDIKFTAYDGCKGDEKNEYKLSIKPDSINARMNMHLLMEKLRWAWEDPTNIKNEEDINKMFENESFSFNCLLFDENKKRREPIELSFFSKKEKKRISFQKLLAEKLKDAIEEFLSYLKTAFKNVGKDLRNVDKVHIFLAGNSSKSILFNLLLSKYFGKDYNIIDDNSIEDDILKSILEASDDNNKALKYFKEDIKEILDNLDSNKVDEVKKEWGNSNVRFCIYPPLRTPRAKKIIDIINRDNPKYKGYDIDDKTKPSGKTGVAHGLLDSETTRVIYLTKDPFQFFVGKNIDDKLRVVLKRDSERGVWSEDYIATIRSNKDIYQFYYTESGDAGLSEEMDIEHNKQKIGKIDTSEEIDKEVGDYIYIRPVSENEIEWRIVRKGIKLSDNDDRDSTHFILLNKNI